MIKFFSKKFLALAIVGLSAHTANAADEVVAGGACGANLIWELTRKVLEHTNSNVLLPGTCTLTISGTGDMDNYSTTAPWHQYNQCIKKLVINNGITSIGDRAFCNLNHWFVDSVFIPNSVIIVGDRAFEHTNLFYVSIGKGVTHIGNYAFNRCTGLETIDIKPIVPPMLGENALFYWEHNHLSLSATTLIIPYCVLSDYQSAPNWSAAANYLTASTDFLYECTAVDIFRASIDALTVANNALQAENAELQSELLACSSEKTALETALAECESNTPTAAPQTQTSEGIQIYPSPVKDELKIENGALKIKSVEIMDITGKIVYNLPFITHNSIDVSGLSSGVYLLKTATDKGTKTERFIKK